MSRQMETINRLIRQQLQFENYHINLAGIILLKQISNNTKSFRELLSILLSNKNQIVRSEGIDITCAMLYDSKYHEEIDIIINLLEIMVRHAADDGEYFHIIKGINKSGNLECIEKMNKALGLEIAD